MKFTELTQDKELLSDIRDYIAGWLQENPVFEISERSDALTGFIFDLGLRIDDSYSADEKKTRLLLFANLFSEQLYLHIQNELNHLDIDNPN